MQSFGKVYLCLALSLTVKCESVHLTPVKIVFAFFQFCSYYQFFRIGFFFMEVIFNVLILALVCTNRSVFYILPKFVCYEKELDWGDQIEECLVLYLLPVDKNDKFSGLLTSGSQTVVHLESQCQSHSKY